MSEPTNKMINAGRLGSSCVSQSHTSTWTQQEWVSRVLGPQRCLQPRLKILLNMDPLSRSPSHLKNLPFTMTVF